MAVLQLFFIKRLVEILEVYNNYIKKTRQGYAHLSILKPTGYFFYRYKNGIY